MLEGEKKYKPNVFFPSLNEAVYNAAFPNSWFKQIFSKRTIITMNNSLISLAGSAHNGLEYNSPGGKGGIIMKSMYRVAV